MFTWAVRIDEIAETFSWKKTTGTVPAFPQR